MKHALITGASSGIGFATAKRLMQNNGHWQIHGYGPYAVEDKSSARVLGTVGFWYPNDWPSPEIKWALAPEYWGQGYASEAAPAVLTLGG